MATKIYEECLKHPQKREGLDDATVKRFVDNPSQPLDASQSPMLKSPATPAGHILHAGAGALNASLQQVQVRNQPLTSISQDSKSEVSGVLNQRSPATDPSLFGVTAVSKPSLLSPGATQSANSLNLKGWPLTGLDQLRPTVLPTKSFIQSPQPYPQIQMLNPQQQQQLLLQAQNAQGNLGSTGSSLLGDLDSRRYKVMLNRNVMTGKDNVMQSVGSPLQAVSQVPRTDELLMKMKLAQQQQQQGGSQVQQPTSQPAQTPQQQASATAQQQQDRLMGAGDLVDGHLSNAYRSTDQAVLKSQTGRKRKQPASSSGPSNSTGTGNTAGHNSAPSTPSTHTPGDVMMSGALQQSGSTSKSPLIYGSDGTGPLASSSNQLAEPDRFVEDVSLDDNVESFLSHEEADEREPLFGSRSPSGHSMDVSKGFSFSEFRCLRGTNNKVLACHFSFDGKLLASAGHDKKAFVYSMDSFKLKNTLEEHNLIITDVRFSPVSTRLATSSFDRTVRVWDADNPSYSLRSFSGHTGTVMSLDFHPNNEDLICSCDAENEIRYWSVNQGSYTHVFQGGTNQVRFQPRSGRLLAAAADNVVTIFDIESQTRVHSLQRHTKLVHSVCWDASGDYVASVSEDSVRVWAVSNGECVHELSCSGSKFQSCVFHPTHPQLLVIGCYQSLELWSMRENKSLTVAAHDGLIAALAQSSVTGMMASASHDKCVKLWK